MANSSQDKTKELAEYRDKINALKKEVNGLKAANKKLQANEKLSDENFKTIFNATNDGIFLLDKKTGAILDVNDTVTEMYGYQRDEIKLLTIDELSLGKSPYSFKEAINYVSGLKKHSGKTYEWRAKNKNKELFWVRTKLKQTTFNGKEHVLAFVKNIDHQKQVEKTLGEKEEFYKTLFELSPAAILLEDKNGTILDVNPAYTKTMQYGREELIGKNVELLVGAEGDKQEIKKNLEKILSGKKLNHVVKSRRKNGTNCYMHLIEKRIKLPNGDYGVLSIAEDITKRVNTEQALRENENRYRQLFDHLPYGGEVLDINGNIIDCSQNTANLLGYKKEDLIGKHITNLIDQDGVKVFNKKFPAIINGKRQSSEIKLIHKDGTRIDIFNAGLPILNNESNKIDSVLTVHLDISDRKKNEKDLRLSEESYRGLFDNATDAIYVLDKNSVFLDVNKGAEKMYGYSRKELIGNTPAFVSAPGKNDLAKVAGYIADAFKGKPQIFEFWGLRKNKEPFPKEVRINAANYFGKNVVIAFAQDITERKKAGEALRLSEERFRKVFERGQLGIALAATDYKFIEVNPKFSEMTEYSVEELYTKTFLDITHPDDIELSKQTMVNFYKNQEPSIKLEKRFLTKSKKTIWTTLLISIIYDNNRKPLYTMGIIEDITDRKKAEEALRASEEKYRGIFESVPTSITMIDSEGFITDVNPYHLSQISKNRVSKDSFVGDKLMNRQSIIDSGLVDEYASLLRGEPIHLDGVYFPETTGGKELYANVRGVPLREDGKLKGAVIIMEDITARKKAEEEHKRLEAQIQHAQKLESLGVLSGGIAHDFNNLLTGILGNAGLAELELPSTSPVLSNLKNIETASIRAADLCRQLLAYSGKGKFVVKALNLNDVVKEMGTLLNTSISKKIVLKHNFSKNLPAVEVDTAQIRQVIMNLIINASDAIGENSGVISVTTGAIECDNDCLSNSYFNDNLKDGIYVYLEVSDTGIGMDKETESKIFDPFYTTKFTGRGLGLAAVLGIIRGHNGTIQIKSKPGKGTSFKVLFPCSDKEAVSFSTKPKTKQKRLAESTVLIVDDEDTIRALGKQALEKSGFSVLTAEDGLDGLEIFKKNQHKISVILLDMTMPHMNGEETFRELRLIDPQVKVILSSGYNEQEATNNFTGKGLAGFLQKPYRATELIKKIETIIAEKTR